MTKSSIRSAALPSNCILITARQGFCALLCCLVFRLVFCLALFGGAVSAESVSAKLDSALQGTPGQVGACASALPSGAAIYSRNANLPLKPASVQKLVTTGAVLSRFGPESRFATELYVSGRRGKRVEKLYIRGLGDPSLTTEGLWMLARSVRAHGIFEVDALRFDSGLFDGEKARQGQRAYLGGTSALSFNYNSFAITACPGESGKAATVTVEPFEMGASVDGSVRTVSRGGSSVSVEERTGKSGLRYQVSGQVAAGASCEQVYRSIPDPAAVAAEVFRKNLIFTGVDVPDKAFEEVVPVSASLLVHAESKPLHEIIWGMNHWSTNVIAEQLLMALGGPAERELDVVRRGQVLERDRAIALLQQYAESFGSKDGAIRVMDGSGLSHDNRINASLLCSVMTSLQQSPNLGIEFENSLAVSGRSGTLRERTFGLPPGMVRAKTGTIDGVSSLAGYLVTRRGNKYAFAIIQNSSLSKGEAVRVEDRFVRALNDDGL